MHPQSLWLKPQHSPPTDLVTIAASLCAAAFTYLYNTVQDILDNKLLEKVYNLDGNVHVRSLSGGPSSARILGS